MPTVKLPLPRKALGTYQALKSSDGVNWSVVSHTLDSVKNEISVDIAAGDLVQLSQKSNAKQTKPSSNKPVLNGEAGVGNVYVTSEPAWQKNVLTESLMGKVATNGASATSEGNYSLTNHGLLLGGKLQTHPLFVTTHNSITIGAPNNDSPAVKALPYQISDNGQVSIGIQANELTWNDSTPVTVDETTSHSFVQGQLYWLDYGTSPNELLLCVKSATTSFGYMRRLGDVWVGNTSATEYFVRADNLAGNWGDDSEMKITATGTDTFVDLNGKTNLSVVHELSLPIGWSKSIARVSTQTAGVDL